MYPRGCLACGRSGYSVTPISRGCALQKSWLRGWNLGRLPGNGPAVRVVLRHISPLIGRRLPVRSGTSIAQLHRVLQVAFGWEDLHLHHFEVRAREYGRSRDGGMLFDTDARSILIGDLNLRRLERFTHE